MIRQICYTSTARGTIGEADLQCILGTARHHNRALQVTGLLALGGATIFQVLEGPRDNIECLIRRIRADRRHSGVRILHDEMVATRDFGAWPMAFRTLDAHAMLFAMDDALADPVAAIVSAMSNPLTTELMPRLPLAA